MTYIAKKAEWIAAMRARGHDPILEDGDLDFFVLRNDTHNGPGCRKCGWSCCWHCIGIDEIPECAERDGVSLNQSLHRTQSKEG